MPPEPHRLVADVDAALVQQVLDVSERKREPDVHHHRQADDLGAGLEVPEGGAFGHPKRLAGRSARLNQILLTMPAPEFAQGDIGVLRDDLKQKGLAGADLPQPAGRPHFAGVIGAPQRTRFANRAPVAGEIISRRAAFRPETPSSIQR